MYGKEIHKNELVEFQYKNFFDIILGWNVFWNGKYVDEIDLCIFYKKKSGETGGVYTNTYNHKKNTEGSLMEFPFIFLMGEGRPNNKYNDEEIIRIANIHDMEEVYIVAIDYNAAIEDETGFDIPVTLETTDTKPMVAIPYSRTKDAHGAILLLATLKESDNSSIVITNKSKQISLSDAYNEIPGFDSIVTQN